MGNAKIRVLLVDDSEAYRMLLRRTFEADSEFEVVSHAVNGRLALPRIRHYMPDFVVLDQEMPEMDGLDTLRMIRDNWPQVGVIMFSSHTVEGARTTLKALELGALDFVRKPAGEPDLPGYLRTNLLAKLKQFARLRRHPVGGTVSTAPIPGGSAGPVGVTGPSGRATEVCAIGVSTGGPVALRQLLERLPQELPAGLLIVQHMPPLFTRQMAEHLDGICALSVKEAEHGESVQPCTAYIAPGGRHMSVLPGEKGPRISIGDEPPEMFCRPSVNVLFRSVAKTYGNRAIALIMTGMGEDGYEGIRELHAAGARIFAQNADSCLIYGMPARPTREGLVEASLDLEGLADAVVRAFRKTTAA